MIKARLVATLFLCLVIVTLSTGCSYFSSFSPPVGQHVEVILKENDFKIKKINLRGEATVFYLFGFVPVGDERLWSRALADLYSQVESEIAGTPSQLINWTVDEVNVGFPLVGTQKKVIFRADLMTFNK